MYLHLIRSIDISDREPSLMIIKRPNDLEDSARPLARFFWLTAKWYADLTENTPFFLKFHGKTSSDPALHTSVRSISCASGSWNYWRSLSLSQAPPLAIRNSLTVPGHSSSWWPNGRCTPVLGVQLVFHTDILEPSPLRHISPVLNRSLPWMIPRHA
jgi:hypothetical protein